MADFPISAVMPIRNGAIYLNSAIFQINQCLSVNDEIVVVDDNSTDDSLERIKRWARLDSRVVVVQNSNPGLGNALNKGIMASSNEWVARFDVDDTYLKERIDQQKSVISSNTVLVFSDYHVFGNGTKDLGIIPSAVFPHPTTLSLISSQRSAHPSAIFRKSAWLDSGCYIQEDFPAEDISLWLRMSKIGEVKSVPEVLLHYRLSRNSTSQVNYLVAKDKTRKLLLKYQIPYLHFENVVSEFDYYLDQYGHIELGLDRSVLLLRDLIKYQRIYGSLNSKVTSRQLMKSFMQVFKQKESLHTILKFLKETKARHEFEA